MLVSKAFQCPALQNVIWSFFTLADINECTTGMFTCPVNAGCVNTIGSYTCTCNTGYESSGGACVGMCESGD